MNYEYEIRQAGTANSMMLFCLGAAVGATAMLLCAPASGRTTRAHIADGATSLKHKAEDLKAQAADKAVVWKTNAMSATRDALTRAADAFDPDSVPTRSAAAAQRVKS